MLKSVRQAVIGSLWETWRQQSSDMQKIETYLEKEKHSPLTLDHFAIIDLPSAKSGINELREIFSAIGYKERGRGYLADKQNDFLWMAEEDSLHKMPHEVLPQVVVADFRLEELPTPVKNIIEKYAALTKISPLEKIKPLSNPQEIASHIFTYLNTGRDWPLPSVKEFLTVHSFNELLAWVLVFGRKPNHFTLSVHLLPEFQNLTHFNQFIEQAVGLPLNRDGGLIKGGPAAGIAQSSTKGKLRTIQLADGEVELPADFTEFVWRYPVSTTPVKWGDYFTDFVAQHADYVIESLYVE